MSAKWGLTFNRFDFRFGLKLSAFSLIRRRLVRPSWPVSQRDGRMGGDG
jgi:hypothetical protein